MLPKTPAPSAKSAFSALPCAAATCMPERVSASSMLVSACLNLRPPVDAGQGAAAVAAEQPGEGAADAAGVVLAEHDRGRDDEIGRHHLPLADVLPVLQLAALRQRALLHHVVHAGAALDDLEAVRLLHQHADDAGRRAEPVALQVGLHLRLRLDDGEGALGRIAMLELAAGALRAVRAGAAGGHRAALAEGLRRRGKHQRSEHEREHGVRGLHLEPSWCKLTPRAVIVCAVVVPQPVGPCLSASDVNESA